MASADGGGDGRQQRVEVLLAAHEPGDLEQAGEPRHGVGAVVGECHQPVSSAPPVLTEAPLEAPQRPLALSEMAISAHAPKASRVPRTPGPFPVGAYAAKLRDELRKRARVQLFGEVFGLRVGRARVWFELRDAEGAVPCAMWRDAFEELRLPLGALSDGGRSWSPAGPTTTRARAPRRRRSPSPVSGLRLAGEGDLLAQVEACARRWRPRACSSPRSASSARRCRAASAW
jgi:hypothetical protein